MRGKKFIALLFFGSKLQLKKEVNQPSVSVKLYMFFLSLETSTVAFRTVLDELLCFFLALNLTSFQYFCQESFFFAFFSTKICPENSREIGRFLREFVSSNPVKFHFFSRELSEALNKSDKKDNLSHQSLNITSSSNAIVKILFHTIYFSSCRFV